MQFRELIELNKFAFGVEEMPSVRLVVGYNKIYLSDKNLENMFIYTGVPTLLKGHVGTNPNFAFYFDDYACLADIRYVLGYDVPFIEFTSRLFSPVKILSLLIRRHPEITASSRASFVFKAEYAIK